MQRAERPGISPYSHGTRLLASPGGYAVRPPGNIPGGVAMSWLSDGVGGWIGRGGEIEGQSWLCDGGGGYYGLGPGIDGLRWRRDAAGGYVGLDGVIRGLRQCPDGAGGFVARAAVAGMVAGPETAGPEMTDPEIAGLEMIRAEGAWGGPVFRYRGAEIWTNAARDRWQVWIDEHPLRGVTLRRLRRAFEIIDAWVESRALPPV